MITDEEMESAVRFYGENAVKLGEMAGATDYLDHKRKIVRAELFNDAPGKTIAEREMYAESHPDYLAVVEERRDAMTELHTLRTLLKAAELRIDCWRSQNASHRKGHV